MRIFKQQEVLLPKEKQYYIWVFLFLLMIVLSQFFLYPKIMRIRLNMKLSYTFQKQIKAYEKKITNSMLEKIRMKKDVQAFNALFKSQNNPVIEFNRFIENTIGGEKLKNISSGKKIVNTHLNEYPVYIEFADSPLGLSRFISSLSSFSFPVEITSIEIDALSRYELFARIQMLLKEKQGEPIGRK